MEVDERALKLSCALAFLRWRTADREDFLETAEELGIDDGPLALAMWMLLGRTGGVDFDDAAVRATLRFCEQILSGATVASPRDAI